MRNVNPFVLLLISSLLFLPGCDLIFGVFQAGFWTAIVLIVALFVLSGWAIYRFSNKDKNNHTDENRGDRNTQDSDMNF